MAESEISRSSLHKKTTMGQPSMNRSSSGGTLEFTQEATAIQQGWGKKSNKRHAERKISFRLSPRQAQISAKRINPQVLGEEKQRRVSIRLPQVFWMLPDGPAAVYPTQITGEFSIAETLEVKEGKAISSNHMASDTKGHKGLISEDPGSPPHVGLKSSHHRCPVTFTTKDIVFTALDTSCLLAKEPSSFHH